MSGALMFVVDKQLLLPAELGEIPHGNHSVRGRRSQKIAIQGGPGHIVGGVAKILVLSAHITRFREAIAVYGVHLKHCSEANYVYL